MISRDIPTEKISIYRPGILGWIFSVAEVKQDNDLAQWRRMIAMRAVDMVQQDICCVGGVTRALRVAAMAAKSGLKCVPRSANLALVTVLTLHMCGAILNFGDHVEITIEDAPWARNLYEPRLEVRDGRVAVPAGSGWGVKINPEWVGRAKREINERA